MQAAASSRYKETVLILLFICLIITLVYCKKDIFWNPKIPSLPVVYLCEPSLFEVMNVRLFYSSGGKEEDEGGD